MPLLRARRWRAAARQIEKELLLDPDNHWLWAHLSKVYVELHHKTESLRAGRKAVTYMPSCPLAQYYYAYALCHAGKFKEAIRVCDGIVDEDTETLATGPCGEGLRHTRSLQNDARFLLGVCHQMVGRRGMAVMHMATHIRARRRGQSSVWDRAMVLRRLNAITRETGIDWRTPEERLRKRV